MRLARWISGLLWVGSWVIIYQEVFRWHHMSRTLRFTPPEPPPGVTAEVRPGLPVLMACACAVAAPITFLSLTAWARLRRRG